MTSHYNVIQNIDEDNTTELSHLIDGSCTWFLIAGDIIQPPVTKLT